jgi:type IV secretion system protein VirB6
MGDALVQTVQVNGGFLGPTFNVVGESLRYCVVMILMAIICFQAPSLASALTGGAAVQQGMQMVQNALLIAGLRSVSAAQRASNASSGGVIRAGAGLPFAAGQAVGAGARFATGTATGAGAAVRQGFGAVRTAAYRLAALRGRA